MDDRRQQSTGNPTTQSSRAASAWHTADKLLTPVPEVVLLLDSEARIIRSSSRHAGPRLNHLEFAPGRTIHTALHGRCDGQDCELISSWARAWKAHHAGLPVAWELVSQAADWIFELRLEAVSYACGVLFGDSVHDYENCSVLFVRDISKAANRTRAPFLTDATGLVRAPIIRSETDSALEPGLVATLDKRLRTITGRLLVAQESERKRIAAELHDGLGQTLSLLHFELEGCLEEADANIGSAQTDSLRRSYEHVKRALRELRETTRNLRPTILNSLGVVGSLQTLCADFRQICPDVTLRAELSGAEHQLPDDIAIAIYRITQEALNNVARHAHAREVMLILATPNGGVELLIRDDGVGLPAAERRRRGLGLITMRERTAMLGGNFELTGAAGKGCSVRVRWASEAVQLLRQ